MNIFVSFSPSFTDDPIMILWNPLGLKKRLFSIPCILYFSWFMIIYLEIFTILNVRYAYQKVDTDHFIEIVMNAIIIHIVNNTSFSSMKNLPIKTNNFHYIFMHMHKNGKL